MARPLPKAMELARHQDVKKTMKYTAHWNAGTSHGSGPPPFLGSTLAAIRESSADDATKEPENEETPAGDRGFVSSCHSLTESDLVEAAGIE